MGSTGALPENERTSGALVHYLVGTAAAGKGFWFSFKGKSHTQYVAHGLAQGLIAFKLRIGVDVCMHLHIHIILVKEIA